MPPQGYAPCDLFFQLDHVRRALVILFRKEEGFTQSTVDFVCAARFFPERSLKTLHCLGNQLFSEILAFHEFRQGIYGIPDLDITEPANIL